MSKTFTREQRIYLALWRKAHRTGEAVELLAPNKSLAISIRLGLYRIMRIFREGRDYDYEITQAGERFVVSIREPNPGSTEWKVCIIPRATTTLLQAQFSDLGLSEEDLLTPQEAQVAEDLQNFTAPATNPFYTREA